RLQQVREALVPFFSGTRRHPKDRALSMPIAGHSRSARPALASKDARVDRHGEAWNIERILPDNRQFGAARVYDTSSSHALFGPLESERFGYWRFALQDHVGAVLDAVGPKFRSGGRRPQHKNPRQLGILPREAHRREDPRPGARLGPDHSEMEGRLTGECGRDPADP